MRELSLAGDGGEGVRAWHWPAGREGAPGVLVVHEVFGLDPFVASVGERFAALGWAVLAPDLYSREGLPGPAPSPAEPAPVWERDAIRAAVAGLPDRRALADLEAGLEWLGGEGGADPDRLAVVGFCMGGCLAFLLGCRSRRPAAVVDFYGRLVYGQLSREKPVEPLEMALGLEAPLLAHFGERDASIPLEQVEELGRRLSAFAKPHEILVHPGAEHGFANPLRPAHHPERAREAWERTEAFLREVLDEPAG